MFKNFKAFELVFFNISKSCGPSAKPMLKKPLTRLNCSLNCWKLIHLKKHFEKRCKGNLGISEIVQKKCVLRQFEVITFIIVCTLKSEATIRISINNCRNCNREDLYYDILYDLLKIEIFPFFTRTFPTTCTWIMTSVLLQANGTCEGTFLHLTAEISVQIFIIMDKYIHDTIINFKINIFM